MLQPLILSNKITTVHVLNTYTCHACMNKDYTIMCFYINSYICTSSCLHKINYHYGEGAVLYQNRGALIIGQTNITDNFASSKNTVYMTSGTLSLSERVNFMKNQGSLYVFNTRVEFKGIVAFINNFGDSGGAITAILSEISFNTASTVTIFNNTATNGGGMSLTQNTRIYIQEQITSFIGDTFPHKHCHSGNYYVLYQRNK